MGSTENPADNLRSASAKRLPFRPSLDGRLMLAMVSVGLLSAAAGASIATLLGNLWLALLAASLVTLAFSYLATRRFLAPIHSVLRALTNGVEAMRDADYSLTLAADPRDEFGELLALYNEVSTALRDERQSIYQRELLLDSVIQASPLALLLTTDRGDVIYDNTAARKWFFDGRRTAGTNLSDLLPRLPKELSAAITQGREGLIGVDLGGEPETFHVSHRWFHLNARRHRLFLLERMTREMNRQEVETWKKVIRLISHELRNSLGPIASLARSGRRLSELPDSARLATVLSTIEERADHLEEFISGYARFAKLPHPRRQPVVWSDFVSQLRSTEEFTLVGGLPTGTGNFDPAQLEQALINLLRNAREAGSEPNDVELEIRGGDPQSFAVRDRGEGMSPKVLQSALLPFYSTKRSGTGLGLALCREIAEAHGGSLNIANRSGGGLEVLVSLPASDTDTRPRSPTTVTTKASALPAVDKGTS